MPFGRRRFADLVERQLDLFVAENGELVRRVEEALRGYDDAGRDEAEARYGEFLDLVDTGREELEELRDTYERTLDEDAADEYREAFVRGVRARLPRFALELDD
jgi:hypothetical protein